jgi:chemotaxis response regulator CheB
MSEKQILLIESGQFIGGVIHSLFANHDQLRVIEAAPANNRELLQIIHKHNPEIVVLDDTVCGSYLPVLLRYMQNKDNIRVVVVQTDSNQVQLYQKQQINLRKTADFFAIF